MRNARLRVYDFASRRHQKRRLHFPRQQSAIRLLKGRYGYCCPGRAALSVFNANTLASNTTTARWSGRFCSTPRQHGADRRRQRRPRTVVPSFRSSSRMTRTDPSKAIVSPANDSIAQPDHHARRFHHEDQIDVSHARPNSFIVARLAEIPSPENLFRRDGDESIFADQTAFLEHNPPYEVV